MWYNITVITITICMPEQLQQNVLNPASGFISFRYSPTVLAYIKSRPLRKYNPDTKQWEVPYKDVVRCAEDLSAYDDVQIVGSYFEDAKHEVHLPEGFTFKTKPYPHQVDTLLFALQNKCFLLGDDQGLGKALVYGTKVLTPAGYVNIENIRKGDLVVGKNGKPCSVTATFDHKNKDCFDVKFTDGTKIRCCEDHLWQVNSRQKTFVWDTKKLASKIMRNKADWNYSIPLVDPVEFKKRDASADPYLAGRTLGNCKSEHNFIPEEYKWTDFESRISVLQGLMDTSGYVDKESNSISFYSASAQLAKDVRWLAESVGAVCDCIRSSSNPYLDSYTVTIKHPKPYIFFRVARKKDLLTSSKFKPKRNIESVTPCGKFDCRCISVDSEDSLYVIENFIVTHNTKQIIDLFRLLKFQGKAKRCLVICCVNGNKYNWEEEVARHSDCKSWILGSRYSKTGKRSIGTAKDRLDDLYRLPEDIEFVITNVETLRLVPKGSTGHEFPIAQRLQELCRSGEFGLIALDEAHKNKNPDNNQSKAAMLIKDEYMIPMSGTFVLNKPLDLFFPLKWSGYEDHSWWQFKNFYERRSGFTFIGYKNIDLLREKVEPVLIRRMKADVLDLPDKIKMTEYVEMGSKQSQIYSAVRNDILGQIDKIRLSNNPLADLIRLRQATGYPGILSTECEDSAKMNRMMELVEDEIAKDGRVIIFSQWSQITERAAHLLNKNKEFKVCTITGDDKQTDRMTKIKKFQEGKCNICIGTIGALGTGFTLNTATAVIFLDEPWNRGLKDQAEDRAHRIGTKYPVTVVTLITKNTIDERINDIVYRKGAIADFLVDGHVDARSELNRLLDI